MRSTAKIEIKVKRSRSLNSRFGQKENGAWGVFIAESGKKNSPAL